MILERSSRKIDLEAMAGSIDDRFIAAGDDLYSLSAVELFRLFPGAWDFQLKDGGPHDRHVPHGLRRPSACRRWRRGGLVDAGYYDNSRRQPGGPLDRRDAWAG